MKEKEAIMEKEFWKDIEGYEGLYQVSNLGNVKSLKKEVNCGLKNVKTVFKRERILKQHKNTQGYYFVSLCKNNKYKQKTIHRLIAENFIPNGNNFEQVNHINGNKEDNRIENLEWCTQRYNIQEAWRMGLAKQGKGKFHPESKAINQYDLNGEFIKKWEAIMDIQRELGYFTSCICACCKGRYKTAYGYIWRYADVIPEQN